MKNNRCWCGKFKSETDPVCQLCYRKMYKQCQKCMNHQIIHDIDENEDYDYCSKKVSDLERAQCKEYGLMTDKRIHTKIMQLINYYNHTKQRYTHYIQLRKNVLIEIIWNNHWDYHFYQLEHFNSKYKNNGED